MTSKGTERDLATQVTLEGLEIDHVVPMAATPSPEELAPDVIGRIHAAVMKIPEAEKTSRLFRAVVTSETQTIFRGNTDQFNDWVRRFVQRVQKLGVHIS